MNILMLASTAQGKRDWMNEWLGLNGVQVENHNKQTGFTSLRSGSTVHWVHAGDIERVRGCTYDLVFTDDRFGSWQTHPQFLEAECVARQRLR